MDKGGSARFVPGALLFALLLLAVMQSLAALGQATVPTGPTITYNFTENASITPAAELITAGGTITTMNLNGTFQDPHWKGFVGNVTGRLALRDSSSYSLYEWALTTVSGEVYVSRSASASWANITCANLTHVTAEETAMSHNTSAVDSISNTFALPGTHPSFTTATTSFLANQCNYTTNTYVNGTSQATDFYEVLLWDGSDMVYASLLENRTAGFDLGTYDFQIIVAENGSTQVGTSTPYYFYVELL